MQFDLFDDLTNAIVAEETYAGFRTRLSTSNCRKCALCEGRTNIVVDRGIPGARIMVIGEAPGEHEDRQARAFVGRAGQLFDKIMASIGLDTDRDMLIANVVKCRPPENRKPRKEEAAACIPFLRRQIALVKPAVIILLGATALEHMDPRKRDFSMAKEAGRFFTLEDYPGIQWMVLYHPAALLYDAGLKPAMWEHAKALKQFLEGRGLMPAGAEEATWPSS